LAVAWVSSLESCIDVSSKRHTSQIQQS
jgi:hypothetical protein